MPPEIDLPAVPALVLVIANLLSPWVISLVNQSSWTPGWRRFMAVVASAVLTVVALGIYYAYTGEPVPNWPVLVLLGVMVSQATYALIAKPLGAKALEEATSTSTR